jgi:hypothetical protein
LTIHGDQRSSVRNSKIRIRNAKHVWLLTLCFKAGAFRIRGLKLNWNDSCMLPAWRSEQFQVANYTCARHSSLSLHINLQSLTVERFTMLCSARPCQSPHPGRVEPPIASIFINNHAMMDEQKGQQTSTSLTLVPFTGSRVTLVAAHPESRSCRTLQMCTGMPQPLQLPLPNIQARTEPNAVTNQHHTFSSTHHLMRESTESILVNIIQSSQPGQVVPLVTWPFGPCSKRQHCGRDRHLL